MTICDPVYCSPPGFSVYGILQARILEWIAIPFSRRYSQPRDWTQVSRIAGRCFTIWTTSKAHVCLKVALENEDWDFFFLLAKPCIMWNFSFPTDQGSIWCALQWKHRALTTNLQGTPSVWHPEYGDDDMGVCVVFVLSWSVVSNSLWPHGL